MTTAVRLDLCPWCTKTLAECTCYGVDVRRDVRPTKNRHRARNLFRARSSNQV